MPASTNSWMRVDEGRTSWSLPAIKLKARTVVGEREKSLLGDPGSEFRLGKEEKEKCDDNRRDEPNIKSA